MCHCNHQAYHLSTENEEYCIGYRNHLFCKVWSDFTLFCFRGKSIFIWLIRANNCLRWSCCSSDIGIVIDTILHSCIHVFLQDLFQFGSYVSSIISSTYVCTLQADIQLKPTKWKCLLEKVQMAKSVYLDYLHLFLLS